MSRNDMPFNMDVFSFMKVLHNRPFMSFNQSSCILFRFLFFFFIACCLMTCHCCLLIRPSLLLSQPCPPTHPRPTFRAVRFAVRNRPLLTFRSQLVHPDSILAIEFIEDYNHLCTGASEHGKLG